MSLLFPNRKEGAQRTKIGAFQLLSMFFIDHLRQSMNSLGTLWRSPFATLMTIGVLGFSITLPSTLYILVKNTEQISEHWQEAAEISLFLRSDVNQANINQLINRVSLWPEVDSIQYIPKEQALDEFQRLSGLNEALNYLDQNPLPDLLIVSPSQKHASPTAANLLLNKLRQEREVEVAKLDIEWLERLHVLLSIASNLVMLLAILLFFAVVLIIGNTIRLDIFNKSAEIQVMKLVGATDGFIQRPFLYTGFWFGLCGGVMAWITVSLIMLWVEAKLQSFALLYQTNIQITGMNVDVFLTIIGLSILLGLAGSAISVHRHIKDIEPS